MGEVLAYPAGAVIAGSGLLHAVATRRVAAVAHASCGFEICPVLLTGTAARRVAASLA